MSTRQATAERHDTGGLTPFRAIVMDIRGQRARRYVVTYPHEYSGDVLTDETSITFLLGEWKGAEEPRRGQIVTLENVQLFERGWRASRARPITPETSRKQ
jgi:hypothetical protein